MASTTYRHKRLEPTQVDTRRVVPGSPTIGTEGLYEYLDETVDSANKSDLDAGLLDEGFAYDSTSPATTPATQCLENLPFGDLTAKTILVNADLVLIEDSEASGAKKKVQVGNLPGAQFGQNYYQISKGADESVTGTTWTQYLRLVLPPSFEAGTYKIQWWMFMSQNSITYAMRGRVQLDDTTELYASTIKPMTTAVDKDTPMSGFSTVELTAGYHTIDIDYNSSNATPVAHMLAGQIEVWRTGA